MAINPETQYPGKVAPSTPDYPYGGARNITQPGDGTGTPWEAALVNDLFGLQQALLSTAGIVPSGDPDKVGASQYLDAVRFLTGAVTQTRSAIAALPITGAGQKAFLSEGGRSGTFVWTLGNFNAEVAADTQQGVFIESGSVAADTGAWIRENATNVSPLMFGAAGDGATTDTTALSAYDAYCASAGLSFDGIGLTYAVAGPAFSCGSYKNAAFIPASGHVGDGPTFKVNADSGVCEHENISVEGFTNNGARISRGAFAGVATFIARGANRYNNNGGKNQTTTTAEADMFNDFVIPVVDESTFSASDEVWIGDGKYQVDSTAASQITLTNNGAEAILLEGSRNIFAAGQYVTLDSNGKNGITIGDGGQAFNLAIAKNAITADDNAWFGVFHWSNTRAGRQEIDTAHASGNGYIGVGLGNVNAGYARGCVTEYNGNNGIDALSSVATFSIYGGVARYNGVDGVFAGGDSAGGIAKLYDYDCKYNRRLGFLLNASLVAADYSVRGVDARNNDFRSFTLTGCGKGAVESCKLGGASYGNNFFIEGKNGTSGTQNHTLSNCIISDNLGGFADAGGNFTDYVSGTFGLFNIINSYKEDGSQISADTFGVDPLNTKCSPRQRLSVSASTTSVAAGATITITVSAKQAFDSAVTDVSSNIVNFTSFAGSSMTSQAALDVVTRTAGIEISAGLTLWVASTNFGAITYNLTLNSPGTRYIVVESDGFKKAVQLEWT